MTTTQEPNAVSMALRSAAILCAYTAVVTALLSGFYLRTQPVIEASLLEKKMRAFEEILPAGIHDNDLIADTVKLAVTPQTSLKTPMTVYRGRKNGHPAVLVLETSANNGYGGKIGLLIGVRADGRLTGVRITAHKETPGLGDYIDPKKDKNREHPWIGQFVGLSFENRPEREWKVKKDGGRFDSIAGATVSPRAVVQAVRDTLKFVVANQKDLYDR